MFVLLTARVFPDPVWAMPTMSLPLRASGKPWAWMGVGSLKLCCIRTSITYSTERNNTFLQAYFTSHVCSCNLGQVKSYFLCDLFKFCMSNSELFCEWLYLDVCAYSVHTWELGLLEAGDRFRAAWASYSDFFLPAELLNLILLNTNNHLDNTSRNNILFIFT